MREKKAGEARVQAVRMGMMAGSYAVQLRRELGVRNQRWARDRLHVESYGGEPVVVYAPEGARHGNFFDSAYSAITRKAEWMRRFNKVHAQGARSLPKPQGEPVRRWRELDSSMSSDALLMNVFCTPEVAESPAVRTMLGVEAGAEPEFGWKARVPLANGLVDRTEVDMRLGSLLVEAKLTETDFQTRKAEFVERYKDLDAVFERDRLPRVGIRAERQKEAIEFPEDYSQEYEAPVVETGCVRAERVVPVRTEPGYASYQLIRNVLAAYAQGCSFCVVQDERRPDLMEAWFRVMAAVKGAEMRVRLKVLTWQELAAALPAGLQDFLDEKYGIVRAGRVASRFEESNLRW
ncbi:MAG TPA: hypothetical protein VGG85_04695 [Terracidiphilus sp.]